MQALSIALLVNVILVIALVSVIFKPKVISLITKRKKLREKQEVTRIQNIVHDYLKQLQKDAE